MKFTVPRFGARKKLVSVSLAAVLVVLGVAVLRWLPASASPSYVAREMNSSRARLSDHVSLRAVGSTDPQVSLRDGHNLLTSYQGPQPLQRALTENQAQPRSLASADYDEDGVPDLVSSYAYNGRGIITVHRGNVDSIYPNAPEAQGRRIHGTFTDAPFLSPALVFDVPVASDFLGAGDFDADGHWDVVTATLGGTELYLLSGDGKGNLARTTVIALPGAVTALTTGEINRIDGLADVAVGVRTSAGSEVLIFEGPEGALRADPEILPMPATITDLALGQLDDEYTMDLAVASGRDLVIIHGRDRKLSLDKDEQVTVKEARRESTSFKAAIKAVAIGDFSGKQHGSSDVALLTSDGNVLVLTQQENKVSTSDKRVSRWQSEVISSERWTEAMKLVKVRVSSDPKDNLLIIDGANPRLHIVTKSQTMKDNTTTYELLDGSEIPAESSSRNDVGGKPVAVLPMRLNRDALNDLVILKDHDNSLTVTLTGQNNNTSVLNITGFVPLAPGCTVEAINPGNELSRTLNAGCTLPSGQFMDLYSFNGTAGQQAVIAMSSTIFNTFLILLGPDGLETTRDDNGGNGTNSRIPAGSGSLTLPAIGTYTIQATSRHPNETGNYTISLSLGPCATVVTNTNDSGLGSLRQAILNANACPGVDTITFNIGSGVQTISPITPLPSITEAVTIDGTTQPGFNGRPIIELSGASTGGGVTGLEILAGNSTVRGLVINRFGASPAGAGGTGILLTTNGGNIIESNFVGTDVNGSADLGNTFGVRIDDGSNNLVGGTTSVARNILSGSQQHGLFMGSSNNLAQGNFVGTDVSGTADLGNDVAGVLVSGVNNTIGGTSPGSRNVISGNSEGIHMRGSIFGVPTGNLVQGNFIGTDLTGSLRLGNSQGVHLATRAKSNTIGGTTATARNIISANVQGVLASEADAGNFIQGNYVGTDVNGSARLGNTGGLFITQDSGVIIGGAIAGARNVISGNGPDPFFLDGGFGIGLGVFTHEGIGSAGSLVQGNYIGTDASGTGCLGNDRDGIFVNVQALDHVIKDNIIGCNGRNGINIPDVAVDPGIPALRITIDSNSIFANKALGINLGAAGITANDLLDPDVGANLQQNFPVLVQAIASAGSGETLWERAGEVGREMPDPVPAAQTINGTLNSTPNATFTVHWYFSADAQCIANQAATRALVTGKVPNVMTNSNGDAQFSFPFDFPSGVTGGVINCTATDAQGNTSEFSSCMQVSSVASTPTPTPTATATPTPTPAPVGPTIFVEAGTNNLAAVDSVSLVHGPFMLTNTQNFSSDQRTRIIFFTTNLGLPQTFQPGTDKLSVQVGGNSHAVETVGSNTTTGGSYIVFRLPDLGAGTYPIGIRLNGVNSTNTPNLTIVTSPSNPAAALESNKAKLAEYLLFPLSHLIF